MPAPKRSKSKEKVEQLVNKAVQSGLSPELVGDAIEMARGAEHLRRLAEIEKLVLEAGHKYPDLYADYLHARVELIVGERKPRPARVWLERITNHPQ